MTRKRWPYQLQSTSLLGYALTLLLMVSIATLGVAATAQEGEYSEAPELTALVEAGELPPVHERLPRNPMLIEPVERVGEYGGTWRTALLGGADYWWLQRTIGYETLLRWTPDGSSMIPNVAESYEVNEDATEFTFYLREGMRWSDGHPFSADDIMFWYEDVFMNEELTPAQPAWLIAGDEPAIVEKIDDYTVTFRFAAPNGLFLLQNATILVGGGELVAYPRHYMEQFHIKYNPEGIDALVQEAGLGDWVDLFTNRHGGAFGLWHNRELPTLYGWRLTTAYGEGTTRVVAERNPYYWKVDTVGNQLPYIDRVAYDLVSEAEVLVLKALGGEIDMQDRHIATLENKALFIDNMERGDYRLFDASSSYMNTTVIFFNLNHRDPVKREIFQNKEFRIGLSHAINRQEIIDLIFIGQGEPYQAAPRPESNFHHERLAKQYTEYDVDLANEYLNRAGYSERDAQGFRLGPDGDRISFVVEVSDIRGQNWVNQMELIQNHWQDVGIDMQFRNIDRSLWETRMSASEHDASVWVGDGGLIDAILDPIYYFPYRGNFFAGEWAAWYRGEAGGEEPPEAAQQQMVLYNQLIATADEEEQQALMEQILDIAAEEFWVMGVNLWPPEYGIARNNFRNVPDWMPSGGVYVNPGLSNPQQYFIESDR